jgi:hypothetical protein
MQGRVGVSWQIQAGSREPRISAFPNEFLSRTGVQIIGGLSGAMHQ